MEYGAELIHLNRYKVIRVGDFVCVFSVLLLFDLWVSGNVDMDVNVSRQSTAWVGVVGWAVFMEMKGRCTHSLHSNFVR